MALRRVKRQDGNLKETADALEAMPQTQVIKLGNVGGGCPDILVGHKGANYLLELKDGNAYPSDRKLTKAECIHLQTWVGQTCVVYGPESACAMVRRLHAERLFLMGRESDNNGGSHESS